MIEAPLNQVLSSPKLQDPGFVCYDAEHVFGSPIDGFTWPHFTGPWNPEWGKLIDAAFPSSSPILASRTRVTPSIAAQGYYEAYRRGLVGTSLGWVVRRSVGMGGQFLANILVAMCAHPDCEALLQRLLAVGCASHGLLGWVTATKPIHEVFRQVGAINLPMVNYVAKGARVDHLLYIHLLIGRYTFKGISSTAEIVARTTPLPHTQPSQATDFDTQVEALIDREVDEALLSFSQRANMTLGDLLDRPHLIGTAGSSTGLRKHVELAKYTKQALATLFDCIKHLRRVPGIRTAGIDKYEAGKLRLLLPGPDAQWVNETIALWPIEERVAGGAR